MFNAPSFYGVWRYFLPLKKRSTPHVNLDFDRFRSGVQGELAVF